MDTILYLYMLLGFIAALSGTFFTAVLYCLYKITKAFNDNPSLENDSHWDNGFSAQWYAEQMGLTHTSAKLLLKAMSKFNYFSKETVFGEDMYKMINLKEK